MRIPAWRSDPAGSVNVYVLICRALQLLRRQAHTPHIYVRTPTAASLPRHRHARPLGRTPLSTICGQRDPTEQACNAATALPRHRHVRPFKRTPPSTIYGQRDPSQQACNTATVRVPHERHDQRTSRRELPFPRSRFRAPRRGKASKPRELRSLSFRGGGGPRPRNCENCARMS